VRPAPAPTGSTLPRAEVGITVDRGPGASYTVGDPITLCVAVNRPSVVRLVYRIAASATGAPASSTTTPSTVIARVMRMGRSWEPIMVSVASYPGAQANAAL